MAIPTIKAHALNFLYPFIIPFDITFILFVFVRKLIGAAVLYKRPGKGMKVKSAMQFLWENLSV